MGDPRYPSRIWRKPKRPLNYDFMMEDLNTLGTYGLEKQARVMEVQNRIIQSKTPGKITISTKTRSQRTKEPILMHSLVRIGLVKKCNLG